MNEKKTLSTKVIILIGIMAAISAVLQQIEIHMPGFLSMDFSDLPAIILGMQFGAIPAVLTELIKNIIKLLTTKTGFVGELGNLIVGCAFVIPIGIGFSRMKKKLSLNTKNILFTFSIATIAMTLAGAVANYFILVPFYANFMGGEDNVVKMITEIIPIIKNKLGLILFYITPFNIVKGIILSIIGTLIVKTKLIKNK